MPCVCFLASVIAPLFCILSDFQGIPTYHTPDQNETDFMKCVRIVIREIINRNLPVSIYQAVYTVDTFLYTQLYTHTFYIPDYLSNVVALVV